MNIARRTINRVKRIEWLKPFYSRNARLLLKLKWMGVGPQFEKDGTVPDRPQRRKYASYQAYVEHQRSKLTMLQSGDTYGIDGTRLDRYDVVFREVLADRIGKLGVLRPPESVLCLAARLGTEVKAFMDLGCFAVGVDLNPGPENAYVLPGDFHHLVFASESVPVVYCNSLDHAFDLNEMLKEIHRILSKGGRFIAEIQAGSASGHDNTDFWEAQDWASADAVATLIAEHGFEKELEQSFQRPWPGRTYVFRKRTPMRK